MDTIWFTPFHARTLNATVPLLRAFSCRSRIPGHLKGVIWASSYLFCQRNKCLTYWLTQFFMWFLKIFCMQLYNHKEGWVLKNWCFQIVLLEKTLESPLEKIKPVTPKGDQPEYALEGLMLKLKLQYFGHLMWRADSLEENLMAGKDWRQEEKVAEDEMVR